MSIHAIDFNNIQIVKMYSSYDLSISIETEPFAVVQVNLQLNVTLAKFDTKTNHVFQMLV